MKPWDHIIKSASEHRVAELIYLTTSEITALVWWAPRYTERCLERMMRRGQVSTRTALAHLLNDLGFQFDFTYVKHKAP